MTVERIDTRFQLRRGTTAQWAATDPVLAAGEPGVDLDTGALKVGDGTTVWSALPDSAGVPGPPGTTDYTALDNLPTLGTAAATDASDYATAAQYEGLGSTYALGEPVGIFSVTEPTDAAIRDSVAEARAAGAGRIMLPDATITLTSPLPILPGITYSGHAPRLTYANYTNGTWIPDGPLPWAGTAYRETTRSLVEGNATDVGSVDPQYGSQALQRWHRARRYPGLHLRNSRRGHQHYGHHVRQITGSGSGTAPSGVHWSTPAPPSRPSHVHLCDRAVLRHCAARCDPRPRQLSVGGRSISPRQASPDAASIEAVGTNLVLNDMPSNASRTTADGSWPRDCHVHHRQPRSGCRRTARGDVQFTTTGFGSRMGRMVLSVVGNIDHRCDQGWRRSSQPVPAP